jgi:hypothetical protein
VTHVGQEPVAVGPAAFLHASVPYGPRVRVRIEAGTLMQKLLPPHLVEPYLASQRSVIVGYVHRAENGVLPDPAWLREAHAAGNIGPGPGPDTADLWVLRWRALDIQTYLAASPAPPAGSPSGGPGHPAFELFIAPTPIPVGTEMYRITQAGEEYFARHDGQAWLRPGPWSH